MTDKQERLVQIANLLRQLAAQFNSRAANYNDCECHAGELLNEAIDLGAFGDARWEIWRRFTKQYMRLDQSSPSYGAGWTTAVYRLKDDKDKSGVQFPKESPGATMPIQVGCPFMADLIEAEAKRIEAEPNQWQDGDKKGKLGNWQEKGTTIEQRRKWAADILPIIHELADSLADHGVNVLSARRLAKQLYERFHYGIDPAKASRLGMAPTHRVVDYRTSDRANITEPMDAYSELSDDERRLSDLCERAQHILKPIVNKELREDAKVGDVLDRHRSQLVA